MKLAVSYNYTYSICNIATLCTDDETYTLFNKMSFIEIIKMSKSQLLMSLKIAEKFVVNYIYIVKIGLL